MYKHVYIYDIYIHTLIFIYTRADEEQYRLYNWEHHKQTAAPALADRLQRLARARAEASSTAAAAAAGAGAAAQKSGSDTFVSRKRPRELDDVEVGSVRAAGPAHEGDAPLSARAERALLSDAQALLADLDSIMGGAEEDGVGERCRGKEEEEEEKEEEDEDEDEDEGGEMSQSSFNSDDLMAEMDEEGDDDEFDQF